MAGDDAEQDRLYEVQRPPTALQSVLAKHTAWLESRGKRGELANLAGEDLANLDLEGANLRYANLAGADLTGTALCGADLSYADLNHAKLDDADLRGAAVVGANLSNATLNLARARAGNLKLSTPSLAVAVHKAERATVPYLDAAQGASLRDTDLGGVDWSDFNLLNTDLRGTRLVDANLDGAKSLTASQLAGADVSRAVLPAEIANFDALVVAGEASKNARVIFYSLLLGCAYSWLTLWSTTDAHLLANSSASELPIIGLEVPLLGFYFAAPALLLFGHAYLHMYLLLLWRTLASLPAVFPDGRALDQRVYPWLLNGLVRRHYARLRVNRSISDIVQEWLSMLLAWWVVPITLVAFWARYLVRRDVGLLVLALMVVIAVMGALCFLWLYRREFSLEGRVRPSRSPLAFRGTVVAALVLRGALVVGVCWGMLWVSIETGRRDRLEWRAHSLGSPAEQWFNSVVRSTSIADLAGVSVSSRPDNYYQIKEHADRLNAVKAASLAGRDLRLVRAHRAFLARANLRGAWLEGGILRNAQLQGADFRGANVAAADFAWADLRGADLRGVIGLIGADLRGANLRGANLQGANLSGTNRTGANLRGANLTGAQFYRADLGDAVFSHAKLNDAIFHWTYLRGAVFQNAELIGVRMAKADMMGVDFRGADLSGAYLARANLMGSNFRGAKLRHAKLRGASLSYADLRGADLERAYLYEEGKWKGTSFSNANLENANLTRVHASGARFTDAVLVGANLEHARLDGANFERASLREANLERARLTGADVSGADFTDATGMKQGGLHRAWGYPRPKLPRGLKVLRNEPEPRTPDP